MKVTLNKNYRKLYTLDDLDRAKKVIAYEKNDDVPAKEWAEYAIREALKDSGDWLEEVIKTEAETARNKRVNNGYWDFEYDKEGNMIEGSEGSGNMDVWLRATARTAFGFIIVGAYLSDIWQTGATPYKQHMYIQYFKEAEL